MSYILRLTCEHYVEQEVMDQGNCPDAYCPRCGVSRPVMDYTRDEWHTSCNRCSFGRSHGMARTYALQAAARHQAINPTHEVRISFYNKGRTAARLDLEAAASGAVMLPGFGPTDELPPF